MTDNPVPAVGTAHKRQIIARSVSEADDKLNAAVLELQPLARDNGLPGILVTRTGAGRYTVELSTDVPYGLTQEATADPNRAGSGNPGQRREHHQVGSPNSTSVPTLVPEEIA